MKFNFYSGTEQPNVLGFSGGSLIETSEHESVVAARSRALALLQAPGEVGEVTAANRGVVFYMAGGGHPFVRFVEAE